MVHICTHFSDFEEPAKRAPFDVSSEHLRMLTNEERITVSTLQNVLVTSLWNVCSFTLQQDIKSKHEKIRQRPMSPSTLQRMEDARCV